MHYAITVAFHGHLRRRRRLGGLVQLDNLVNVVEQSSPPQRYHFNRYESATVMAGLAPGHTLGEGIAESEEKQDQLYGTFLGAIRRQLQKMSK